ncbi:MAG: hypothetical protein ABH854_04850 [Candidatus Diapherotrites archaeon]|nr:hypothetical protein [Candidatus Micrarchaeota archaeon]
MRRQEHPDGVHKDEAFQALGALGGIRMTAAVLKKWKPPSDVTRVTVTKTRIGGGAHGRVHIGRVYFTDGTVKRVAVKQFHSMDANRAAKYQKTIIDLINEGIVPSKMGIVKLEKGTDFDGEKLLQDKWILASELFGSKNKRTKLTERVKNQEQSDSKLKMLTKIANAGYYSGSESVHFIKGGNARVILLDLDTIVTLGKEYVDVRARDLLRACGQDIHRLTKVTFNGNLRIVLNAASPELRDELIKQANALAKKH